VLPAAFIINRYYELKNTERRFDTQEARINAANSAYRQLKELIPQDARIIEKTARITAKEDNKEYVEVIIECEEKIGVTEELQEIR
jgi:hypothetical protein